MGDTVGDLQSCTIEDVAPFGDLQSGAIEEFVPLWEDKVLLWKGAAGLGQSHAAYGTDVHFHCCERTEGRRK